MTVEIGTVIIAAIVVAILNFASVFGALGFLRWRDRKEKEAIANVFMREVGEKLQTEADFQNIIRNLRTMTENDDEEGRNE